VVNGRVIHSVAGMAPVGANASATLAAPIIRFG
jgi:hypothetical protein